MLPGIQIIWEIFFGAKSNLIKLASPRMDRSDASLHVDIVENKSFESTAIHKPMPKFNSSVKVLTMSLPSTVASPATNVSAEATDFTGRLDLRELQEIMWNTEPEARLPKRIPQRKRS